MAKYPIQCCFTQKEHLFSQCIDTPTYQPDCTRQECLYMNKVGDILKYLEESGSRTKTEVQDIKVAIGQRYNYWVLEILLPF